MKAKQSKSPPPVSQRKVSDEGGKFVDHNLMKMKDGGACCVPTPAEPVRLHYKMAGGC